MTATTLLLRDRDPGMSENLWLDAHRQVFTVFREGFGTTYGPLLTKIQDEFESALNQGIRCTMENVEMRKMIAEEEAKRSKAQGELRTKIMAGELEHRIASFKRLQDLKTRMDKAVKRASLAERELLRTQTDELRLQALVDKLKQQHVSILELIKREDRWAAKENSSTVLKLLSALKIGKLSNEDEKSFNDLS